MYNTNTRAWFTAALVWCCAVLSCRVSSSLNPCAGLGGAPVSSPFVSVMHWCPSEPFWSFPPPQTPPIYCCRLRLLTSRWYPPFVPYCSIFTDNACTKTGNLKPVVSLRIGSCTLQISPVSADPHSRALSQQQTAINLIKPNMFVLSPPLPRPTFRLDKASPQPYASPTFNRKENLWSSSSRLLASKRQKHKPKWCCFPRLKNGRRVLERRRGFLRKGIKKQGL